MLGLTTQSSFNDVAKAIILETKRRNYTRSESIACTSTAIQESWLVPTVWSSNHKWYGIYQQDEGYVGRNDPNQQVIAFLDRLDVKRSSPGASQDIWRNIFWLQQAPGRRTADEAYQLGRREYLTEIKRHIAQAEELYDRFVGALADLYLIAYWFS